MRVSIKKILCITDFSDAANHSVAYGIALAREFDANLYLCHVIDLPTAGMYGDTISYPVGEQDRMIEYAHGYLKRLIGDQTVSWEPLVTMGHAASEVARFAKEKQADLVISSTSGRSGWKRLLLGSVTGRLLRTVPCPLMIIRGLESDFATLLDQGIRLKRILVGCDFSPDSELAFQYGLSLAQEFQTELHLAHVIEPPIYKDLLKTETDTVQRISRDLREQLREKLKAKVPEEAFNWCSPQTNLLAGQPHQEIVKYATVNDMDMIVLGVRGHSVLETFFVGSTADRVARKASCPVLLARPMVELD